MQRQRRPRCRHDVPAHGQDAVHLAHGRLEVPAADGIHRGDQQVPDGVARQAPLVVAEAVLEQLPHRRLRLGHGDEAVADVAHGRDPELLPEPARGAPVVRDRDDRGQVGRVGLEAAQQGRKPGAATDGHDAGATGQEAAPVDEVHEGLLGALRERPQERPDDAVGPVPEEDGAQSQEHGRPHPVGQELEGEDVDEGLHGAVDIDLAVELPEGQRAGESQGHQPDERDAEPALHADPGAQPAPQVHRVTGVPARDGRC